VRIIVMAQILRQISRSPTLDSALHLLDTANGETETLIDRIHAAGGGTTQNTTQAMERT
jgi:hypothetical protein